MVDNEEKFQERYSDLMDKVLQIHGMVEVLYMAMDSLPEDERDGNEDIQHFLLAVEGIREMTSDAMEI